MGLLYLVPNIYGLRMEMKVTSYFELKTYQLYTKLTPPPQNFLLYVAKNLLERAKWKYHTYLNKKRQYFPNSLYKKKLEVDYICPQN